MCYLCFFFSKRKTAYWMRISDCSSDVCSSDLRLRGKRTNLPWPAAKGRGPIEDPPREYLLIIPVDSPGGAALEAMLGPDGHTVVADEALDRLLQIGSASRRERVCQ